MCKSVNLAVFEYPVIKRKGLRHRQILPYLKFLFPTGVTPSVILFLGTGNSSRFGTDHLGFILQNSFLSSRAGLCMQIRRRVSQIEFSPGKLAEEKHTPATSPRPCLVRMRKLDCLTQKV